MAPLRPSPATRPEESKILTESPQPGSRPSKNRIGVLPLAALGCGDFGPKGHRRGRITALSPGDGTFLTTFAAALGVTAKLAIALDSGPVVVENHYKPDQMMQT
jgi:hypothetical protein